MSITKQEAKHTPGPWNVTEVDSRVIITDNWAKPFGGTIAELPHPDTHSYVMENARLIAAAPELLEACKTALASMQRYGIEQGSREEKEVFIIEQAIAKAEGKQ
jgi:hypothetical protein